MSTTFAIVSQNEEGEFERIDIAHRSGIGNGLVKIKWFDISIKDLVVVQSMLKNNNLKLSDLHVQAMDNTAQGVKTIGDLIILDDYGTLSSNFAPLHLIEKEIKAESKYFDVEAINNDVISNTKRIEAVETLFNNINEINYINDLNIDNCVDDVIRLVNKYHFLVDDNGVGTDNKFFSDDVKNIIIKYINNKTKGDKNETK